MDMLRNLKMNKKIMKSRNKTFNFLQQKTNYTLMKTFHIKWMNKMTIQYSKLSLDMLNQFYKIQPKINNVIQKDVIIWITIVVLIS